jgi:beta-galactosidase
METHWNKLVDKQGMGLKATCLSGREERLFEWAAGRHNPSTLELSRHPCDLKSEKAVLWRLDIESQGVGTAACGPCLGESDQVLCRELEFEFLLERVGV